jgi:hypothetical protein
MEDRNTQFSSHFTVEKKVIYGLPAPLAHVTLIMEWAILIEDINLGLNHAVKYLKNRVYLIFIF